MNSTRVLLILFSLCLHGTVAGTLCLFSGNASPGEERVYHVTLAEFSAPEAPMPAPPEPPDETPSPEAPPPPLEPAAPPPPEPEPPREVKPKPISSKKKPEPEKARQRPREPEPPVPEAVKPASGPQPRRLGGLSAYASDHVDQRPSIARRALPDYPRSAKRQNIEGRVLVQLVVDSSGNPRACTVHSADPPGFFEEAALTAAGKTRFIPGKLKGQSVNTVVLLPFSFKLR